MGDYSYLNLRVLKITPGKEDAWAEFLNTNLDKEFQSGQDFLDAGVNFDVEDYPVGGARHLAERLIALDKDAVWWMVHSPYLGEAGYLADYNYELGMFTHDCDDSGTPIIPLGEIAEVLNDPDATLESVREGIRDLFGMAWAEWREDWIENGDKREREALAREEAEVLESIKAAFRNQS